VGLSKVIFVLVIALVGWMFYKKFVADAQRLSKGAARKRKATANNSKGTLVLDPKSGEYRLKKEAEE
jgi:membrane protein implicated in regulation of membrane protease activity